LQAARQHRYRDFLRVGGREHELDVLGRLLERLEQRVETAARKHVHFVYQVDLVTPDTRCIGDVVEQFPGVINTGARGRVDFDQIEKAALVYFGTRTAASAGRCRHALFAIEALGQYACEGGLANASGAGEQVGVVQSTGVERIDQGPQDMLLPRNLGKGPRTPLSREDLVTHGGNSRLGPRRRDARVGSERWRCTVPATSRRPNQSLPLLPSGPGGVYDLSPREDRHGPP